MDRNLGRTRQSDLNRRNLFSLTCLVAAVVGSVVIYLSISSGQESGFAFGFTAIGGVILALGLFFLFVPINR